MSTFFITDRWEGEIQNKEPHKHKEMKFYPIDALPKKLIPYIAKALEGFTGNKPHTYYKEYRWQEDNV